MTAETQHRLTTADGTTLAVTELAGEGNPIVALHGFTGDASTMRSLVDDVRGARPAWLIDIVGHGRSDAPEHDEAYSMNSVVDQILSVVGQRPPETVHLVGYSMGGRIALSMAARAPWYFRSITLLSASPGIDDPNERGARYDADHALADRIEAEGVEWFSDWWLSQPIFAPMVSSLEADELAHTRAQRATNSAVGLANSLRGTGTGSMPPLWAALGTLRSPLLALAGSLDPKYTHIAEAMVTAVPFGQLGVIEDAGHVVHVENPGEVSRLLRSFLEGCETAAR